MKKRCHSRVVSEFFLCFVVVLPTISRPSRRSSRKEHLPLSAYPLPKCGQHLPRPFVRLRQMRPPSLIGTIQASPARNPPSASSRRPPRPRCCCRSRSRACRCARLAPAASRLPLATSRLHSVTHAGGSLDCHKRTLDCTHPAGPQPQPRPLRCAAVTCATCGAAPSQNGVLAPPGSPPCGFSRSRARAARSRRRAPRRSLVPAGAAGWHASWPSGGVLRAERSRARAAAARPVRHTNT